MRIREKEFRIYEGERPRVLLLGNGLCRAYGGISWDGLLDEIKDRSKYPKEAKSYIMPMPLKAAMLTNNSLASKMREITKETETQSDAMTTRKIDWRNFTFTTLEMREAIKAIIARHFDYVLTTNYSYEIEAALTGDESLTSKRIITMMNFHEVDYAQTQFLINTFNLADSVPVWHIHGEARKPDSMVIGSYYYGKMVRRCVERLDGFKASDGAKNSSNGKAQEFKLSIKKKKAQRIGSWIDAFVLGDVYILGLGLDFSESDLWWLIEFKSNNPELSGKTVFFDPDIKHERKCLIDAGMSCQNTENYVDTKQCRNYLLTNAYNVEIRNLGINITDNCDYQVFYRQVIKEFDSLPVL